MKILWTFFLLCGVAFSCKKDKYEILECNVSDPLIELEWLKDMKNSFTNCTCMISIFQGTYNGRTVFFTLMNDPLCDSIFGVTLIDCEGYVVKIYKFGENEDFYAEVVDKEILYSCKD